MGYTDQDQLAINTIRVLAVSTYLTLISVAVVFFFGSTLRGTLGWSQWDATGANS